MVLGEKVANTEKKSDRLSIHSLFRDYKACYLIKRQIKWHKDIHVYADLGESPLFEHNDRMHKQ